MPVLLEGAVVVNSWSSVAVAVPLERLMFLCDTYAKFSSHKKCCKFGWKFPGAPAPDVTIYKYVKRF